MYGPTSKCVTYPFVFPISFAIVELVMPFEFIVLAIISVASNIARSR